MRGFDGVGRHSLFDALDPAREPFVAAVRRSDLDNQALHGGVDPVETRHDHHRVVLRGARSLITRSNWRARNSGPSERAALLYELRRPDVDQQIVSDARQGGVAGEPDEVRLMWDIAPPRMPLAHDPAVPAQAASTAAAQCISAHLSARETNVPFLSHDVPSVGLIQNQLLPVCDIAGWLQQTGFSF